MGRRTRCTGRCRRRTSRAAGPARSPVHPGEPFRGQRGAGGADPADRGEVQLPGRRQPGLGAGEQVRGAGAEVGHAVLGGQPPQRVGPGVGGAAVVEQHGGPGQQAAGQVVPHHPAGGGVPEERVARPEVLVEGERLEVLEDDPAVPVHDRLGQPGGAGGVEHPQRMIERHLLELQPARLSGELVPGQRGRAGPAGRGLRRRAGARAHGDHRGQPGQAVDDLGDRLVPAVNSLPP